ncbi:exported hypothetical protein [metagenome]|uniref:Uncharacterized protein n=1 Tax=metagenome TaxID=256318 RepID=A0A2P2BXD7_9ZZZZ
MRRLVVALIAVGLVGFAPAPVAAVTSDYCQAAGSTSGPDTCATYSHYAFPGDGVQNMGTDTDWLPLAGPIETSNRCNNFNLRPPYSDTPGSQFILDVLFGHHNAGTVAESSLGTRSLGFYFARQVNGDWTSIPSNTAEAGFLTPVSRPTESGGIEAKIWGLNGQFSGHLHAVYFDNTSGFTDGYWVGSRVITHNSGTVSPLSIPGESGWYFLSDNAAQLNWTYFEAGSSVSGGTASFAEFATSRGGNGDGGYLGLEFGCDGGDFLLDEMELYTGAQTHLFEYESRLPSVARISDPSKKKLNYKQQVRFLADAASYYDAILNAPWVIGTGQLWAKPRGKKWRRVDSGNFNVADYAHVADRPTTETTYQFRFAGNRGWSEATASPKVTVKVRHKISAKPNKREVRRGSTISVTGELKPGHSGIRVKLLRKSGTKWKSAGRATSRANGKFTVKTTARTLGTSTFKVEAGAGKGNLGGARTKAFNVKVKPRPPAPQPSPPSVTSPTGGTVDPCSGCDDRPCDPRFPCRAVTGGRQAVAPTMLSFPLPERDNAATSPDGPLSRLPALPSTPERPTALVPRQD